MRFTAIDLFVNLSIIVSVEIKICRLVDPVIGLCPRNFLCGVTVLLGNQSTIDITNHVRPTYLGNRQGTPPKSMSLLIIRITLHIL